MRLGDSIGLVRFVPEFDETLRETPDSCSEAQRFFLDIAFRMALLDYASAKPGTPATFLCETPETALDMSYVDNVVEMFAGFAKGGHTILLTANVQRAGIAEELMKKVRKPQRRHRVLNLLDIGQLTEVHKRNMKILRKTVRAVTGL
jgi:hypothetical protein